MTRWTGARGLGRRCFGTYRSNGLRAARSNELREGARITRVQEVRLPLPLDYRKRARIDPPVLALRRTSDELAADRSTDAVEVASRSLERIESAPAKLCTAATLDTFAETDVDGEELLGNIRIEVFGAVGDKKLRQSLRAQDRLDCCETIRYEIRWPGRC